MSTAQLSPGTIVDGRFTIGAASWARQGAQSYAATDERGQPVVLTAYAPACFSSGLVLERSLRELRQLQTLQSPRVASVIACGKLPDGGIYEVDAPLPDARLDGLVQFGALPGPQAASIIEQIGEGLLEAQKAGVIHRNLGPRVVFVGSQGAVVTGFSVGEPHGEKSFGPLDTIAPEQVEGKVVDQRTLIYNLAALMHMLITGAPLYAGEPAAQLPAHLGAEIPADVHARLRRALGKDPRMRPMMLKQFLAELRAIGGGPAQAPLAPSSGGGGKAPPVPGTDLGGAKPAGAPSSRGWTMFMQGEGQGAPAAGAATPAAASEAPTKPKTRGWTMFMEGSDEPKKAEDKPAGAKPSTRGWTMFMEDDEGQAPPADTETPIAQAAAASAPAPASEGAAAQPKTRGWTMFMEEEAAAAEPVAHTVIGPAPGPNPAVAPAAVKPSTRGWTMFMKEDEASVAEAVALAQPAAPAPDEPATQLFTAGPSAAPPVVVPPAAAAPAATASTPKSRGWTMFTEASEEEATLAVSLAAPMSEAAASTPAVAEPASAPAMSAPAPEPIEAAPEPGEAELAASASSSGTAPISTSSGRRGEPEAPSKKRGWTMFMEKPLEAKPEAQGGPAPSAGESNAKGWTVFSPTVDGSSQAADSSSLTVELDDEPEAGDSAAGFGAVPLGSASGQTSSMSDESGVRAQAAADDDRMRAKTLIVTGPPDESLGARPKTMVAPPGSSLAAPRVTTLVNNEPPKPPSHDVLAAPPGSVSNAVPGAVSGPLSTGFSGPLSTGTSGPISTGLSGPVSSGMPVHAGSHALEPAKKGSPVGLIVVGVLLVAAAIVAAVVMFT